MIISSINSLFYLDPGEFLLLRHTAVFFVFVVALFFQLFSRFSLFYKAMICYLDEQHIISHNCNAEKKKFD